MEGRKMRFSLRQAFWGATAAIGGVTGGIAITEAVKAQTPMSAAVAAAVTIGIVTYASLKAGQN
jgi:hypothetical protein